MIIALQKCKNKFIPRQKLKSILRRDGTREWSNKLNEGRNVRLHMNLLLFLFLSEIQLQHQDLHTMPGGSEYTGRQ